MLLEPAPTPSAQPVVTSRLTIIMSYVVSFLLGALFGVLGTVVHRISFSFFGLFPVPIGLIIALPALALLLVGLRMVAPSRWAALLAAAAAVAMVALLALPSPGGSVLIPDGGNGYGMIWLLGSTLVAVVVLAWPRLGPPRRVGAANSARR